MTVFYCKLKTALPNIVIRGGSETPKIELFMAIALHWDPLTFLAESSIIGRRQYGIYILDSLVKYDFMITVQTATFIDPN